MNLITSIINFIMILLVGTPSAKHDLRKKPTKEDHYRTLNCWVQRNFYIIALAAIIILLITFVVVCFALVGVSATESGIQYNQFNNII